VRLLIGDADQFGHLLLGQPEHDPSLAHARADMRSVPRARIRPRPGFMLDLSITVAIVPYP
jgi:hypothetical protein